jgi:LmbE family N-acetylglucosaminyl deacetylase
MQRGGQYPLLLPHHSVEGGRLRSVDGADLELPPALALALSLCDGQRTLATVVREAGISAAELIKAHDDGLILIWRRPVPAEPPTPGHAPHSVIVSPHLDDAALSCGGRLLGDESVLVLNVFSRSAWWRFPHTAEDAERVMACRRTEEALVSRLTGCPQQALDLPEALLRGHAMADVFTAPVGERDAEVAGQVGAAVGELARAHPLAHWFVPLAVGGHVDHRIARDAARAALERAGTPATHVHFYEDLPYAAKLGPRETAADFSAHVPGLTLRPEELDIDDALPWKLEVLRAYWSQFRWPDLAELKTYAKGLAHGQGAEVVWGEAGGPNPEIRISNE